MPQFNFLPRFADAVEAGTKRQTVRARRKRDPQLGQTAHCFTGLRTTSCRKLGAWPIELVEQIEIDADGTIRLRGPYARRFYTLPADYADRFAVADGLADAAELVAWIRDTHGLPFEGTVTYW